ncbi:MAG: serine/threonine protein kinase, partial [Clostridia bacterium]|nr:serine/threonine protein kinase [Clostridia bacterium]
MAYSREESAALPAGSLLKKRYRSGRVLGRGGAGITYEAFDTAARRAVALKEFCPAGLCLRDAETNALSPLDRESGTQFFMGSEAFLSQHRALMDAAGSQNVVTVLDAFFENGTSY